MTIFKDEIVNNKAFEHANLIFTDAWTLTNKIMLNIMQKFKFDFFQKRILDRLRCTFYVLFPKPYIIFLQCIDEY